jgi:sulfate transport system ATP-binding protein
VKVELRDVRKSFNGERAALDRVSLTVADGEFLALLGPSGSGKTTLLRVLAGLDFADSGSILFDGRPMDAVPARDRRVGFVFQHYALFRHMSVARNVAFGLEIRPRPQRPAAHEIRTRVHTLLDLLGIGELGGRYPAQLSGGQRQRVALARALAIEPGLLLLDEPFGALDAQVRKNLRVWLRELHVRMGLTSVFVTHDQAEALEMADRVAVLRAGQIEQVDEPERLYADPATAFVHEFLGESVRLACVVRGGRASIAGLPDSVIPTDCPDGPGFALIRPHEIGVLPGPGPAQAVAVHATGPLTRVRLAVADQSIEVLCQPGSWIPAAGAACNLDISRARIYPLSGSPHCPQPRG